MENPKQIVQPSDLPVRKSHSQVVTVTGGTLVFIAGMTSRSEKDATPVHPGDMRAQLRQVCENIGRAAFRWWRLLRRGQDDDLYYRC
jgi:enamine deaminase RidA (YjgF/YER057c/UK114 family)